MIKSEVIDSSPPPPTHAKAHTAPAAAARPKEIRQENSLSDLSLDNFTALLGKKDPKPARVYSTPLSVCSGSKAETAVTRTAPREMKGVWGLLGRLFFLLLPYKVHKQSLTLLLARSYPVTRGRYEPGSQEVSLPALSSLL